MRVYLRKTSAHFTRPEESVCSHQGCVFVQPNEPGHKCYGLVEADCKHPREKKQNKNKTVSLSQYDNIVSRFYMIIFTYCLSHKT